MYEGNVFVGLFLPSLIFKSFTMYTYDVTIFRSKERKYQN